MTMTRGYQCAKCGHTAFESSEFRATGGFLTKIFDIQTKKFTTVSCTKCQYTELYKGAQSTLGNVFDFMTRG
jgi:predicted nucleic-acid-binding Zn-ribbon protein